MLDLVLRVGVPLSLLLVGYVIGTILEQRHLRELTQREAAMAHVLVTNLRRLPPGMSATAGTLVSGNVVVATDYFKRFLAGLRNLVGGEIKTYRRVMDRGRREARLRMVEEASRLGAQTVINVRYLTSTVANDAAEIICYGTAIR
ncbi:MAG: YbjQ family protein [Euzebya sp.]